jgi:hypothetical protein
MGGERRHFESCRRLAGGILASAVICLTTTDADASERAAQLVNSFQIMCTIEPLDFARSEAKAAAMKLPVREDKKTPPNAAGHYAHAKSWLLPLKTGPHEFSVAEAMGPKGFVKSCGIAAADVERNDFRSELVKAFKLGPPANESTSGDGTLRTTIWTDAYKGSTLMLSSRTDRTGIYLFLQNLASR